MSRPASPPALAAQCHICGTLLSGALARVFRVAGIKRSPRNPNICSRCDTHVEEGRLVEMTVVFADLIFVHRADPRAGRPAHARGRGRLFARGERHHITRHGGFIDKYIGEAVMALFNVPIHHERRAVAVLGTAVLTFFMVGFEIIAHIILHSA